MSDGTQAAAVAEPLAEVLLVHTGGARFRLSWPGAEAAVEVDLSGLNPEHYRVSEEPLRWLMEELTWHLQTLSQTFHPEGEARAKELEAALMRWGEAVVGALRDAGLPSQVLRPRRASPPPLRVVHDRDQRGLKAGPDVLRWPWAALQPNSHFGPWGKGSPVRLSCYEELLEIAEAIPGEPLRILLVSSRASSKKEVSYRAVSEVLLELVAAQGLDVEVTELRHPTPSELREELTRPPGSYRVVHVDGHGLAGGRLLLEAGEGGGLEAVRIQDLMRTLRDGEVQVLVLTACQSAAEDADGGSISAAESASHFVDGVVGMGWDLHVDGARRFVEGFYRALLDEQRELGEAVVRAREHMSAQRGRRVSWHVLPLHDWLNPVVFQSALVPVAPVKRGEPFRFARAAGISLHSGWPLTGTAAHGLPHGFIGRDQELHRLNRSWGQGRRLFHVHGPLGAGTTSFARWWLLSLARRRLLGGRIHYFNPTPTSASALYEELLKRFNALCPSSLGERRLMLSEVLGPDDVLLWDDFDPSAPAAEGEHDNASEVAALMQTPAFRQGQRRLVLVGRGDSALAEAIGLPLGGLRDADSLRLAAEIAHERGVHGKDKYTELKLEALKGRTPGEILAYFEPEAPDPGGASPRIESIRKDPRPPSQETPVTPNPDFSRFSDYKLLSDALFTQIGGYEELVTFLRGYAYTQRLVGQFGRGAPQDVCMSVAVLLLNRGYVDAAFLANLEAQSPKSPPELGELRRRLGL